MPNQMKKLFAITISILFSNLIFAQEPTSTQPKFSTYYYQKKELFEMLPDTKNEIIFLGNSITDGCEWGELFKNKDIKNRGISGDITDGVLFRLDEVTRSKPDKIFIMIGVNDLSRNKSPDYILTNYSKILQTIKENTPDTYIYIQSILPVNDQFGKFGNHTNKTEEINQVNKGLVRLARNFGCTFIDLTEAFTDSFGRLNGEYTNDGLHLTAKGYLAWKDEINKFVK